MTEYIIDMSASSYQSSSGLLSADVSQLREAVVRCRDCKHFTYADVAHGSNDWCAKHEHIGWSVNGFCAWGERLRGDA